MASYLFFNFPDDWGVPQLWKAFKFYGDVGDVYMARRRMRNGKRFGFVRFKKINDVIGMEKRLNGMWTGTYKLRVFMASKASLNDSREFRNQVTQSKIDTSRMRVINDHTKQRRSYAEILKQGSREDNKKKEEDSTVLKEVLGEWQPDIAATIRLKKCAIGKITSLENLEMVHKICRAENVLECEVKQMGGRNIMLAFENETSMSNILKNRTHGIHHWVKDLRRWTEGFCSSERATWLRIYGVPLHAWKQPVFKEVANNWGHSVKFNNYEMEDSNNFEFAKVMIFTSIRSRIDELRSIKVGNLFFRVRIVEEGIGSVVVPISPESESDGSDWDLESDLWKEEEENEEGEDRVEESVMQVKLGEIDQ